MQMVQDLSRWLDRALKHADLSQARLARALSAQLSRNIDRAAVNKMLNGGRAIAADELLAISEITGFASPSPRRSARARMSQALGYVGAGSEIVPIDDHAQGAGLEEVELPPGVPADSALVIVRGDSMHPRYFDGEYLFYREYEGDFSDLVGQECVVQLDDGRTFVKVLKRGQKPGRFNLESFNAPTLKNQSVKRAGPVIARVNRGVGR
jgi:phage repressor protein C with HTH and peptisase S24 domain